SGTVRRLRGRFGDRIRWFTPLGYRGWFRRRGVRQVVELDWWQDARLEGPAGAIRVTALPCQHWTARTPFGRNAELWASWGLRAEAGGPAVYFGGDSGYFPGYPEIGARTGPYDALLMPIGAYEPRWFMRPMHMDPEEA